MNDTSYYRVDCWQCAQTVELEALNPEEYEMAGRRADNFCVRIRLDNGGIGEASDKSKARAITSAVARAIRVDLT